MKFSHPYGTTAESTARGPSVETLGYSHGVLTFTIAMAVTGVAWQIRATTLYGGGALAIYLVVMITSLAYRPQVAVGVYLAAGGALVFGTGIALSVYREKLLKLPEQMSMRKGIFKILKWRESSLLFLVAPSPLREQRARSPAASEHRR